MPNKVKAISAILARLQAIVSAGTGTNSDLSDAVDALATMQTALLEIVRINSSFNDPEAEIMRIACEALGLALDDEKGKWMESHKVLGKSEVVRLRSLVQRLYGVAMPQLGRDGVDIPAKFSDVLRRAGVQL